MPVLKEVQKIWPVVAAAYALEYSAMPVAEKGDRWKSR